MIEVIAECGLNHLGKLDIAKKMVEEACIADVDAVKFQTYIPRAIVHENDKNFKLLSDLALSNRDWVELAKFCKSMEIEFISTPGDIDSLKFLVEYLGVRRIKIGSDDLTYKPLIEEAAKTRLPLILSTGMASYGEVAEALDFIASLELRDRGDVTLLHCVSLYPCPLELANLSAIKELRFLGCPVGYSDHVAGYLASVAAAALGAKIIEKHFMLSEHRDCVDAAVSINELELVAMVTKIRMTKLMLGGGVKYPSPEEAANIEWLCKQPDGKRKLAQ